MTDPRLTSSWQLACPKHSCVRRKVRSQVCFERGHPDEAIRVGREQADQEIRPEGGALIAAGPGLSPEARKRDETLALILELLRRGTIRGYKRIICFDHDVLAKDQVLRSGVLRVGEGPGTIDRTAGEHCRLMMKTKGCSLYVAPAIVRSIVVFFGTEKIAVTVETAEPGTGGRVTPGAIFFCDPQTEILSSSSGRSSARPRDAWVAVHEIRFPEDAAHTPVVATR